jgi:hypothetical protein
VGLVASPITGPAGNHEYLLWLQDEVRGRPEPADSRADDLEQKTIEAVVAQTLMA